MRRYLHPIQPTEDSDGALSFPPHYMTDEEIRDLPEYPRNLQIFYLILRNTMITLWNLNVKVSKLVQCQGHLNIPETFKYSTSYLEIQ